ncbi:transposase [Streptomyces sp. 8L]|uniref:transposase n=1 Tax=Streptomyces sp. 8L TaxID=2877242 RepID=UPI001CD3E56D|nr:transposase [Streptomyces sp. 8L]MCA1222959.1 transposase [Streptomyces sp. 8L]
MKNYPPQFKADAVALYQLRPDGTIRHVAADLGINIEIFRDWIREAGASRPRGRRATVPAEPPTPPEAENTAVRQTAREPEGERDILRKAARYFAAETRWRTDASSLRITSADTA